MATADNPWWSSWRETDGRLVLHVDLAPDADREARAFALLDDEDKERWGGFLVDRARRQFALCRAALRISICERLGCSNRELSFGRLKHGKPYAKVNGRRVPLGFNVSHSGRHGLIAFADKEGLGVDVEERVALRDLDAIAKIVYSPSEQQALAATSGRHKVHLFFRLWTLKESVLKALGRGLTLDPSGFEIPESMLHGVRSSVFRFPHAPSALWWLADLGEPRFAAAVACRLPGPKVSPRIPGSAPRRRSMRDRMSNRWAASSRAS